MKVPGVTEKYYQKLLFVSIAFPLKLMKYVNVSDLVTPSAVLTPGIGPWLDW